MSILEKNLKLNVSFFLQKYKTLSLNFNNTTLVRYFENMSLKGYHLILKTKGLHKF